jgi:hypothetical protein
MAEAAPEVKSVTERSVDLRRIMRLYAENPRGRALIPKS